jgi:hypothetical protein
MTKPRWSELPAGKRAGLAVVGVIQIALAAAAWADLARRPAVQVRGSKALWALLIGINFIGPISYFVFGRRR